MNVQVYYYTDSGDDSQKTGRYEVEVPSMDCRFMFSKSSFETTPLVFLKAIFDQVSQAYEECQNRVTS